MPTGETPIEPPPAKPVIRPPGLGRRVDAAVRKGLDYLYAAQQRDGSWASKYASQHPGGVEALVILTALEAGEDITRPELIKALTYIEQLAPKTTYVRAVRAMVYARLPGKDYAARLATDAAWLSSSLLRSSGWGYGPGYRTTRENPSWVDNSNTYLAMLALRQAERAGARVAPVVWSRLRGYWTANANPDGGVSYQPPAVSGFRLRGSSYGSMTAAGILAMHVVSDAIAERGEPDYTFTKARRLNPSPLARQIAAAQAWLARHAATDKNPQWVWGAGEAYEYYYLWCLTGVCEEAGLDKIGAVEPMWDAAGLICDRQKKSGCWTDPSPSPGAPAVDDMAAIRTCFAILSLVRARAAVAIDRYAYGPSAQCDGRDAANLAKWMTAKLGFRVAWRNLTTMARPAGHEPAPLLYIRAGETPMPVTVAAGIRTAIADGRTVIIQPFAGRKDIADGLKAQLKSLLPELTALDVPNDHPVYSLRFVIPGPGKPKLLAMGDSCRLRLFVLEDDASGAWHQNRSEKAPFLFELPANLLLYTTDLGKPQSRLTAPASAGGSLPPVKASIRVARLRHGGDWNVCAGAVSKLQGILARSLSLGLSLGPAVDPGDGVNEGLTLLWMTGTKPARLTPSQRAKLKVYLISGGTLLIDSAMGDKALFEDAKAMLEEMFGPGSVSELPADHELITGAFAGGMGCDLTRATYTRAARTGNPMTGAKGYEPGPPPLLHVEIAGRVAVVLSPLSITGPLQGQPLYNCHGLSPQDAARLAVNLTLYAVTRKRPGK